MSGETCELNPGDVCTHGANAFPRYRVIHVHEGRVWLRDIDSGVDGVVDATQCRRAAVAAPAHDEPHHDPSESALVKPPFGPGIRTDAGQAE